jgi:hypothetical protein
VLAITSSGITLADPIPKASVEKRAKRFAPSDVNPETKTWRR